MKDLALTIPGPSGPLEVKSPGGIGSFSLDKLLSVGITALFTFAIVLTLFFLIYGGISYITSGGDKQKVANARQKLTYTVVGLIIVFLAFFIVNFIGSLFGITPITQPSGPWCIGQDNC